MARRNRKQSAGDYNGGSVVINTNHPINRGSTFYGYVPKENKDRRDLWFSKYDLLRYFKEYYNLHLQVPENPEYTWDAFVHVIKSSFVGKEEPKKFQWNPAAPKAAEARFQLHMAELEECWNTGRKPNI